MARKSRRIKNNTLPTEIPTPPIAETNVAAPLSTGAYVRLSVDKKTEEDEMSAEMQAELIRQFINGRADLNLIDIYIDKGYTGTNFDRPEFNRMMEDVRTGKIQCIVVKDLSRFGRNVLETGYYLETLLPKLNVRFISINDGVDSSKEESMDSIAVPVKNLVNEMYAKQFSKKQTAIYELHSQRGDAKILRSTYGYSIDRERNRLVPNPETAPYVQIIFRWYLMGIPMMEIVNRLKMLEVMTPFCYKATFEEGKPVPENDRWRPDRVKTILRNQTYAGDTVYGKRRKILYKNQPMYHTPKEEWVIHSDTHEPLVSRKDFEKVQEMFDRKADFVKERKEALKEQREQYHDSFPQKIFCMDCGIKMLYSRYTHTKYAEGLHGAYYICEGDDLHRGCYQKCHEDSLRIIVMEQIQLLVRALCSRKSLLQKVKDGSCDKGELATARRRVQNLSYQLSETEKVSATLYENFVGGILDAEEYRYMKEHYISEKQRLKEEIKKAEMEMRLLQKSLEHMLDVEKHLESYLGDRGFHQELVDELVDRVMVSDSGRIEVRFKCEDMLLDVAHMVGESEVT